jgi:thymidylate synthase (FAD)
MMMKIDVLDHGYVRLVEAWGYGDAGHESLETVDGGTLRHTPGDYEVGIIEAARQSSQGSFRGWEEDAKLLKYLYAHKHCYHPNMQVLTEGGWKQWNDCDYEETFLVPDPTTRTLKREKAQVEVFDCDEEMVFFGSQRMSFGVTRDHRMWFRPKVEDKFRIVRAGEMGHWGHFDPLAGYRLVPEGTLPDPVGQLVGFALGDGNYTHARGLTFHLKKSRKQEYLRQCLRAVGETWTESPSTTYDDAIVFYLSVTTVQRLGLADYLVFGDRSEEKKLRHLPTRPEMIAGIFDGLKNSDGHLREDRNDRVEFSSMSPQLAFAFETLAAMCGYDAHHVKEHPNGCKRVSAFPEGRTSLEARGHYFAVKHWQGKVYCATTSTGLLVVRGAENEFGFVCGNSTPFEFAGMVLEIRAPIFVFREWHRHRVASYNEMSARYSPLPDLNYLPTVERLMMNGGKNKQAGAVAGAESMTEAAAVVFRAELEESYRALQGKYEVALQMGVPKELARVLLPVGRYSQMRASANLRNWLHFLTLRMDSAAQWEIRQFANAVGQIVEVVFPQTWELFRTEMAGRAKTTDVG